MSAVQQRAVAGDEAEIRLDRWFRRHFPELPNGRLQKLLRSGQIRLDGKRTEANVRLRPGQTIRVPPLQAAAAATTETAPTAIDPRDRTALRAMILHEDEALLVLNKPAGLAVQGGSGTKRHVDGMLAALAEGGERPRLVHRLDRDTSGLLVVAKSAKTAAALARAFQQHRVQKLYWALVAGLPPYADGIIDKALAKQTQQRGERAIELMQADDEAGQKAKTRYRTIARAGKVAAWLGLQPLSGRTHQLRVHGALIGCPILGDRKYGGPAAQPTGAPEGLMLHARELRLPHPNGRPLQMVAPLSEPMLAGFRWLGFEPDPSLPGATLADYQDA